MNKEQLMKEKSNLINSEKSFIRNNYKKMETSKLQDKIEKYVPDKLETTLEKTFGKAFEVIFENGTPIIEKMYNREKNEHAYKIREYAANLKNDKNSVRAFGLRVKGSKGVNIALSAVEGMGMGILGMGIPDIPVFLSLILKSVYEISIHYGFEYDSEEEQIFILNIIETALLHGQELIAHDEKINQWIEGVFEFKDTKEEQIAYTSKALSDELLYLKFIQGIPVVGMLGGVSDVLYQKKISDYAELKYKRRFLEKHMSYTV